MNPELLAFLADALRDPATGLNALAAIFSAQNDISLPTCTIVTSDEQAWAARTPIPESVFDAGPLCIVRQVDDVSAGVTAHEQPPEPEIPVLVSIGMLASETHTGSRMVSQLLRCALRSIVLRFNTQPSVVWPTTGDAPIQVEITQPTRVLFPLLLPAAETNVLLAAAIPQFPVYDPWAIGAHVAPPAP